MLLSVQIVLIGLVLQLVEGDFGRELCERTKTEIDRCMLDGYELRLIKDCKFHGEFMANSKSDFFTSSEQRRCMIVEKTAVFKCNIQCSSGNDYCFSAFIF